MDPEAAQTPKESPDEFAARAHRSHRRRIRIIVAVLLGGAGVLLLMCGGGVWYGVHWVRVSEQESTFQTRLRLTGMAANNFHGIHDQFPPLRPKSREASEVRVPLSFHAGLLPHLGHVGVYDSIDKTLPWNDPANLAYEEPLTTFQSPKYEIERTAAGHGAALIVPNSRMLPEGIGLEIGEITDGTSNTIHAGGIDDTSVPAWGDPKNGRDPARGFAGGAQAFGGYSGGGAQVVLGDGSVRVMSDDIAPEVAKALATPAGGDVTGSY